MIKTVEDEIMLEIASRINTGDELDYVMGDDGEEIHPADFDSNSQDEIIMSLVDLLYDTNVV